jgi:Flp pilus assembly pilin Flp
MTVVKSFLLDESGQGMTEYAILIGTLALGAIVAVLAIGTQVRNAFSHLPKQPNGVPAS